MRRVIRVVLDAAGYSLEFVDKHVLRHRFPGVCHVCWKLLNEYGY